MKKTCLRLFCVLIVLSAGMAGYSQTKPAHNKTEATKIGPRQDPKPTTATAPPAADSMALPPLPEIDTSAVPNDELTKEIAELLRITNAVKAGEAAMKSALAQQQSRNTSVPNEFYKRFNDQIDNGYLGRLLELAVVKIYRQKFTADEMKEAIKFYETPVGRKMAAEMTSVAVASEKEGEKIGQFVALQIIRNMMQEGQWK